MKKVQTPVNISPLMRILFTTAVDVNQKLTKGNVTIDEAIDIMAAMAKTTAREMNISDSTIVVTDNS